MKIHQVIKELKRRKVFKVASIYAVTAWLLIQIAVTTFPLFALPEWSSRLVVILSIIGFPIALILAWAYEVVPETQLQVKSVVEEEGRDGNKIKGIKWQTPVLVIMIGVLGFLVGNFRMQGANDANVLPKEIRQEK